MDAEDAEVQMHSAVLDVATRIVLCSTLPTAATENKEAIGKDVL